MYHHSSNLSRNFTAVLTRAYVHTSCFSLRGALRDKLLRKSHSVTGPQHQTSATCNATFPTIARQVAQKIALCNRAFKCPLKWKAVNTPPRLTLRFDYGHEFGSLPFTKKFQKFQLEDKWNALFWNFPVEIFRKKWKIWNFHSKVRNGSSGKFVYHLHVLRDQSEFKLEGGGGGVEEKWNFSEQKFGTLLKSEKGGRVFRTDMWGLGWSICI